MIKKLARLLRRRNNPAVLRYKVTKQQQDMMRHLQVKPSLQWQIIRQGHRMSQQGIPAPIIAHIMAMEMQMATQRQRVSLAGRWLAWALNRDEKLTISAREVAGGTLLRLGGKK